MMFLFLNTFGNGTYDDEGGGAVIIMTIFLKRLNYTRRDR